MFRSRVFFTAVMLLLVMLHCGIEANADADNAWAALHQLDIQSAIGRFEKALEKSPNDISLKRGLILAHHFDCRVQPQFRLVREVLEQDPANPYLLALYEHVAAELETYAGILDFRREIAEALMGSTGPVQFCGKTMYESWSEATLEDLPDDWLMLSGKAPGAWVAGPFENVSHIAAVRPLQGEAEPLDTNRVFAGKDGARVSWHWLEGDRSGSFALSSVMENLPEAAAQVRLNFSLPRDMDVAIVIGGVFHYRMLIDGYMVVEDHELRNAVIRGAVRVPLSSGEHALTLSIGWEEGTSPVAVHLLDAEYQPIEGLTWLRTPVVGSGQPIRSELVHPIFDTYKAYVDTVGSAPDTRYWWAVLQIYNGYAVEAIRELEELDSRGELSLLEQFILYQALKTNEEATEASSRLGAIAQQCSTPLTDMAWLTASESDRELMLRKSIELARKYPGRAPLDMFTTMEPMLTNNFSGFLAAADSFEIEYPDFAAIHIFTSTMLKSITKDYDSALDELLTFCRKTGDHRQQLLMAPDLYLLAGRHDEAIQVAREAVREQPGSDPALSHFVSVCNVAGRPEEAIPLLDSLYQKTPSNLEVASALHRFYQRINRHDDAKKVLESIHYHKPSAVMPYKQIDSLHNGVPYDSIFEADDVMQYWDEEPSEELLGGEGQYSLFDRRQVIVFESGVTLTDFHYATVLLKRGDVESAQEYYIGFSPGDDFMRLLLARRLRKGQAPMAGEHQDDYIIFQDLQPGDAIELHYRIWSSNSGDLWNEFWSDYIASADFYQRYWEYTLLTNRDDVRYASVPPCPDPVIDDYLGFKRISWRGDHSPAADLDPAMLPPYDDILGKLFISTLDDWSVLNKWYYSISNAVLDLNPRSTELARSIAGDLTDDTEKLRRLYQSVVVDIPYQTIGFDYDAAIPQTPDQVLVNRWGDCKDKSHLLIRMLRDVGIDAWPVLVMTRSEGTRLPLPFFGFDHLIVGTVVDGDTLYVDPSSLPFAPMHSIDTEVADQPSLNVQGEDGDGLNRLPGITPDESIEQWTLTLTPDNGDSYQFRVDRAYGNLRAGYRRDLYRDRAYSDLIKSKESYYADEWAVTMSIDTLGIDPVDSVSPVFRDWWSGTMTLSTQELGRTVIVNPPKWGVFSKGILPDLTGQGERSHPVDLRDVCGKYHFTLEYTVPQTYGEPQVSDPLHLADSLLRFDYTHQWDPQSRLLTLVFDFTIEDGLISVDRFKAYVEQSIEVFESPMLFTRE
jgi:tetratricopeptide (TPR) repeat protein